MPGSKKKQKHESFEMKVLEKLLLRLPEIYFLLSHPVLD